jgi:aminoglycoside/choline kinase family phosphotransferase
MAGGDWRKFSSTLAAFYGAVEEAHVRKLKGDASTRAYFRVEVDAIEAHAQGKPASVIIMQLPEPFGPGTAADTQARAFLDVRSFLASRDIPVPELYASDLERGRLVLEDLGDLTFEARLRRDGANWLPEAYGRAIDLLAQLHQRCAPPQPPAASIAYRRRFDAALLRSELDHFREWGLEAVEGPLSASDRAELDGLFDRLTGELTSLPDGLVHRDFQSRNLMWPTDDRLVVIDFQDAFIGPAPYDLVALLCDSYVDLERRFQLDMLERYFERRGFDAAMRAVFERGFDAITVQRKLKDAGRFVFIDRVRKNSDFLPFYTPSLRHVDRALAHLTGWQGLRALLQRLLPGFPERPTPASVAD